ncbi:MAG: NUDIX hydrolase [Pseudomonadales bacterium]|nr:NUDIX hydrolase [Pseudomonadales bacterium]
MKTRLRACGAVILDDRILMVRPVHAGRDYWTLPGGGIESDETPAQAAEREVLEETGIEVSADRFLFRASSRSGRNTTICFLMTEPHDVNHSLGVDPEEAHLDEGERMLQDVTWHPIDAVRSDYMVARVLEALERDE